MDVGVLGGARGPGEGDPADRPYPPRLLGGWAGSVAVRISRTVLSWDGTGL